MVHNTLALLLLLAPASFSYEDSCTQFSEIYADGTELCEVMWSGAFEVTDDEDNAYTMWFFDHENNPNDAVTRTLFGDEKTVDQCHLNYFHKDGPPSPEGDGMSECHPWKNNACCHKDTVTSVDQINEAYGEGYEWDRCGPMSQACERFFVMEACFYECEPSAGLFRKWDEGQKDAEDYNEWQITKMPIKKSFCDAWYDACYNDYFCGKGNYFECQEYYEKNKMEEEEKKKDDEKKYKKTLTIAIAVVGAIAAVGILSAAVLAFKEKQGKAIFAPVKTEMS